MTTRRIAIAILLIAAALAGCATPPEHWQGQERTKRLAAENRDLQQRIVELQSDLNVLRREKAELQEAIAASRANGGQPTPQPVVPEKAPFRYIPTAVSLTFLTAAVDFDGKPGDDGIAAYVEIDDQFDFDIKAAGHFRFDLFDMARPEGQLIQTWQYGPEAASKHWLRFPACYKFKLPFGMGKLPPRVLLKVTFTPYGGPPLVDTREVEVNHS